LADVREEFFSGVFARGGRRSGVEAEG